MENATNFRIVFVTVDSVQNSHQIAKVIINEKLAACCTIIPNCISIFGWQGSVLERNEFVMMFKTSASLLSALEDRIKELHSDEVPEIVAVGMSSALAPYLSWMNEALK